MAITDPEPQESQGKLRLKGRGKTDFSLVFNGVPDGVRDDQIFRFVSSRLAKGLSRAEIETLVIEAARNCQPPFPETKALKKVERAFIKYSSGEPINLTDMGNTARMGTLYGDRIRFCKHLGWLVYDRTRWVTDDLNHLQAWAKDTIRGIYIEAANTTDEDRRKEVVRHAMKCESASRIQAMIQLLPSEHGISVSHEVFDTDKMLLNVVNGALDLITGQLRPHSPTDLITKLAPVMFEPTAKARDGSSSSQRSWTAMLSSSLSSNAF